MSRRRTLMTTGFGATLLGLALLAAAMWLRSDRRVDRSPVTQESVVMLGDSIVEQGPWDEAFPASSIVNQGYSGFTTQELIKVAHRVAADRPRLVYLLAGTNDIRDGHPPAWTVGNLAEILDELASASPGTIVIIQTILPRQDHPGEVIATNLAIAQLAADRDIEMIDLYAAFDSGVGALRVEDTSDGIHLSPTGNRRWATILSEDLARR